MPSLKYLSDNAGSCQLDKRTYESESQRMRLQTRLGINCTEALNEAMVVNEVYILGEGKLGQSPKNASS